MNIDKATGLVLDSDGGWGWFRPKTWYGRLFKLLALPVIFAGWLIAFCLMSCAMILVTVFEWVKNG